jgi:hypothetical protein
MTDRNFALKWAHPGLARNPRYRDIIERQRRLGAEHIAEIQAEQEAKNAELHRIDYSHIRPCGSTPGMPLGGSGLCGAQTRRSIDLHNVCAIPSPRSSSQRAFTSCKCRSGWGTTPLR